MKKLSIAVAMMLGMACSAAQADDEMGQLIFTGKVSSSSCSIDSAGTTSAINYDTLSAKLIRYLEGTSTITEKPLSIKLISCPAGLPIKVKFEGACDETSKGFKDTTGKNIAAVLYDEGGTTKLEGNEFVAKTTSVSGTNELKYKVKLMRWKNAVLEAGSFSIPISYTWSYE